MHIIETNIRARALQYLAIHMRLATDEACNHPGRLANLGTWTSIGKLAQLTQHSSAPCPGKLIIVTRRRQSAKPVPYTAMRTRAPWATTLPSNCNDSAGNTRTPH